MSSFSIFFNPIITNAPFPPGPNKVGSHEQWFTVFSQFILRSCPAHLEAGLTRAVLDEARANYLNNGSTSMSPTGIGDSAEKDHEKFASAADLHPAHPSLAASAASTKGSQGKHAHKN